ncbi:hypothetical protein ACFQ0B_15725 [Nonomuraea thailandensis]
MRRRLRQVFIIGLTLSLLGIGVPAYSEDDDRNCNDELPRAPRRTWCAPG